MKNHTETQGEFKVPQPRSTSSVEEVLSPKLSNAHILSVETVQPTFSSASQGFLNEMTDTIQTNDSHETVILTDSGILYSSSGNIIGNTVIDDNSVTLSDLKNIHINVLYKTTKIEAMVQAQESKIKSLTELAHMHGKHVWQTRSQDEQIVGAKKAEPFLTRKRIGLIEELHQLEENLKNTDFKRNLVRFKCISARFYCTKH